MADDEAFAFEFEPQLEEQERHRQRQIEARSDNRQTDSTDEHLAPSLQKLNRARRYSNTAFASEQATGGEETPGSSQVPRRPPTKRVKHTHQVVCRHWLRGMCIKGEYCDFLHIFDPTRMPPCRQFGKHGRCAEHEQGTCPLRHNREDNLGFGGLQEHAASLPESGLRQNTSHVICIQYLFGYCQCGPHCIQRHVSLPAERRPTAPLPDWYLQLILYNRDELQVPELDENARRESAGVWRAFAEQVASEQQTWVDPGGATSAGKTLESLMPHNVLGPLDLPAPGEPPRIRAFVIKSAKIENILTSVQRGIWATGKANIEKFEEAFRTCHFVIFVMSANESGGFQGYARMASLQDPTLYPKIWGSFSAKLSANYRVQWLKQCKVDFEELASFTNPWNDNKPLKKSRDGQELPLELAEVICLRLDAAPDEDLLLGTPLADQARIDHSTFFSLSPESQLQEELHSGLRQMNALSGVVPVLPSQRLFIPPPPPPPPTILKEPNSSDCEQRNGQIT
eukprot:Gregarina_sp_Poly_1__9235@NODE_56_length_17373_cov_108_729111_g48_i0_p4_GENE_NODE_56_length_17373_cov_108_729111_g48_i0NODE_56_length_17373_cov_108_729111_g48_i0_p4_ORF_typecomplete_len511_score70_02YTH/PF04146_15/6_6e33zfCCCH_3/PF15663_5/9_1e06zfCCCH_3/PF15663_5/1_7Torus/PF16131_5/1_9e05Torus/PF16131_5/9_9e03Torus/PF16131_5/0_8zf_CCCH_4/PF18345_1/2_8e06zf_CCCH_4/PF18345_1/9_3e03zf_CCCH_4/PF18345_1/3_7e03zf_CCCH_4/PF18345_1/4_9e03zfCCCH/PF00642_24/0_0019zfCCCH/PF00642_24/2e02zfCCCH/PF00642_24/3_